MTGMMGGFGSSLLGLIIKLGLDSSAVAQGVKQAEGQVTTLGGAFGMIKSNLLSFGPAGAAFGMIASAAGSVTDAMFGVNGQLEKSQMQFTTMFHDADRAREHVAMLFDFAAKTPYETTELIEASRTMQTFGGDALNSRDNLTLFGDAAAAVSQDLGSTTFWISRLYSAMKAGQPFGESASRLMEMGLMSGKVRTQLEAMQKQHAGFEDMWSTFTGSLQQYNGAMEGLANTLDGLLSTFTDTVQLGIAQVTRPLFDAFKDLLRILIALGGDPRVQQFITLIATTLSQGLQQAGKYFKPFLDNAVLMQSLFTAIGLVLALHFVPNVISAGIQVLKFGQMLLGLLGPVGLVIAAITALIYAYNTNADFKRFVDELLQNAQKLAQDLQPLFQNLQHFLQDVQTKLIEITPWLKEQFTNAVNLVAGALQLAQQGAQKIQEFLQWLLDNAQKVQTSLMDIQKRLQLVFDPGSISPKDRAAMGDLEGMKEYLMQLKDIQKGTQEYYDFMSKYSYGNPMSRNLLLTPDQNIAAWKADIQAQIDAELKIVQAAEDQRNRIEMASRLTAQAAAERGQERFARNERILAWQHQRGMIQDLGMYYEGRVAEYGRMTAGVAELNMLQNAAERGEAKNTQDLILGYFAARTSAYEAAVAASAKYNAPDKFGFSMPDYKAMGAAIPGDIASGIISAETEVLDAMSSLRDILKNGLSPAKLRMKLTGQKWADDLADGFASHKFGAVEQARDVASMTIQTLGELSIRGPRGRTNLKVIGRTWLELLSSGMSEGGAIAFLRARGVNETTLERLGAIAGFKGHGMKQIQRWIEGILSEKKPAVTATETVQSAAVVPLTKTTGLKTYGVHFVQEWLDGVRSMYETTGRVSTSLGDRLRQHIAFSTPHPRSPLAGAKSWGEHFVDTWLSGMDQKRVARFGGELGSTLAYALNEGLAPALRADTNVNVARAPEELHVWFHDEDGVLKDSVGEAELEAIVDRVLTRSGNSPANRVQLRHTSSARGRVVR